MIAPFTVVVVPFPYSDRLAEKRRPALVVSNARLERDSGLVWVAMITSVPSSGFGDMQISDQNAAGLPVRSFLRCGKLATIEPSRIIRPAGMLSAEDSTRASRLLKACAGF